MLAKLKGIVCSAVASTLSFYILFLIIKGYAPEFSVLLCGMFLSALGGIVIAMRQGRHAILTGMISIAALTVILTIAGLYLQGLSLNAEEHLRVLLVGLVMSVNGAIGGIGYKLGAGWSTSPPNRIS